MGTLWVDLNREPKGDEIYRAFLTDTPNSLSMFDWGPGRKREFVSRQHGRVGYPYALNGGMTTGEDLSITFDWSAINIRPVSIVIYVNDDPRECQPVAFANFLSYVDPSPRGQLTIQIDAISVGHLLNGVGLSFPYFAGVKTNGLLGAKKSPMDLHKEEANLKGVPEVPTKFMDEDLIYLGHDDVWYEWPLKRVPQKWEIEDCYSNGEYGIGGRHDIVRFKALRWAGHMSYDFYIVAK